MPPQTHYPPNWIVRLLALLGAPYTASNAALMKAWGVAEGGTATWNPLNTTFHLSGSSGYNSAGVQNYTHPIIGLCATALTLDNGFYTGIVSDLQSGNYTPQMIVSRNAKEFDTWGTGAANILRVLNV